MDLKRTHSRSLTLSFACTVASQLFLIQKRQEGIEHRADAVQGRSALTNNRIQSREDGKRGRPSSDPQVGGPERTGEGRRRSARRSGISCISRAPARLGTCVRSEPGSPNHMCPFDPFTIFISRNLPKKPRNVSSIHGLKHLQIKNKISTVRVACTKQ